MTRTSIQEYTEAIRGRYLRAPRKEKGKILDEFTKVTGRHRKAAIRLIRHSARTRAGEKRRRPQAVRRGYGWGTAACLEATDRLCSKRLQPFLPELVQVLRRHAESRMSAEVEAQLCRTSPATIDRLLNAYYSRG